MQGGGNAFLVAVILHSDTDVCLVASIHELLRCNPEFVLLGSTALSLNLLRLDKCVTRMAQAKVCAHLSANDGLTELT